MNRKLRVVIAVTVPYVVKYHLPNTLKRISADFDVCVLGGVGAEFNDMYPNIKWININIERKINPISDLLALFSLCRFFLTYKPDIVHSLMPKAGLIAALAGFICRVPVRIHTFTGQVWSTKRGFARIVLYAADRVINLLNSVCLTDSPSQSAFLYENRISHTGRPLPVLSKGSLAGVELTRFNSSSLAEVANQLRVNLGIGKEHFVFAFIARKTRDKGAIDVLKAFSSVSAAFEDVRLLFVGPDEDGEIGRLHKTNPELFVNVIEVDHVSNHEVYLAAADVLCLPSYREGFGTIVIDAAAMGVPTIGSRIPGLIDSVVDQQTGMLFSAGNLDELVSLMRSFVENRKLRQSMGACAKARVEEFFTADLLYASLKKFYLDCARNNLKLREKLCGIP